MERQLTKGNLLKMAGVVPAGKLAMEFLAFGEAQSGDDDAQANRFATCVLGAGNSDANCGVYNIMTALIRRLAAKDSVEDTDGEAVEACRKICDVMGWEIRQ